MDMARLESALYHPIKALLVLVPYTLLAFFIGKVTLNTQIKAELFIISAGAICFFLDLFLQTLLEQDAIGRFVYVVLVFLLLFFLIYTVVPSYVLLLAGRGDLTVQLLMGFQAYLLTFFIYRSVKKFFTILWDLEIA
ncbi:MAG: hypothetical protein AAB443_02480 [Patescibacteria group bacterium]